MHHRLLSCCALVAGLLATADASAFCRSLATEAVVPQCPTVCPSGAPVVFWSNACVGYSLQKDASRFVSYDEAVKILDASMQAWNQVQCTDGGHPSINPVNLGAVVCNKAEYNKQSGTPNQNVIVFRDDSWPDTDAAETIALTTTTFDDTGKLYDADMEINTYRWGNTLTQSGGQLDLQSVITHEAGHFFGLTHSLNTSATMYCRYDSKPGSEMRTLDADDIEGICAAYPSNGTRTTGANGTQSVGQEACDATPRHGFASECGSILGPINEETDKGCGCRISRTSTAWGAMLAMGIGIAVGLLRRRRGRRIK